jgi:DivIVA domain-containing protein
MIDLTPLDVRKKKRDFTKAIRGYEPQEVDQFLDTVAERLEEVVKLNLSLRERVELLSEKLSGQEGRERAVQEALISAQSLKQTIEDQTKREAELLRRESETAAEGLRRDSEAYADAVKREADAYADTVKRGAEVHAEVVRREADSRAVELRHEIDTATESVRENVKRLLLDRRRELVELNRGRARFLKTFRTLLERELDAVEVAESNIPSEELDLDVLKFGRGATKTEDAVAAAANGAAEAVVVELVKAELAKAADMAPADAESVAALAGADDHVIGAIAGPEKEPLPDPLPAGDQGTSTGEERWGVR